MGENHLPGQVTRGGPGERLPIAVGIGIWALLFILGLTLRTELASTGREWWIWTALSGVLLGCLGYTYLVVRRPRPTPGERFEPTVPTPDPDDVLRRDGPPTGHRAPAVPTPAAEPGPPETDPQQVQPKV